MTTRKYIRKLVKAGKKLIITIPKDVVREWNLTDNSYLELTVDFENKIIIAKPVETKIKIVEELVEGE